MGKKNIQLVFLVVLLFAATFFASHRCSMAKACDQTPVQSGSPVILAPGYMMYSLQALNAATQQSNKIVLYFWAPWCSTCTSFDQDLQSGKIHIPSGVIVLRVSYDQALDLRDRYHVTVQHTFVEIDKQGNPISYWVGGSLDDLSRNIH